MQSEEFPGAEVGGSCLSAMEGGPASLEGWGPAWWGAEPGAGASGSALGALWERGLSVWVVESILSLSIWNHYVVALAARPDHSTGFCGKSESGMKKLTADAPG